MLKNANIHISGFADEIGQDFDKQLSVVKELGMNYICVRSAGPKSIAQFSPQEFTDELWTKMQAAGVGMSSVGSPIGKVGVNDEEGFALHLQVLENLCQICKIADCKYIRIFSFYIPEGDDPDSYHDVVIAKLKRFVEIAERHGVILIHENEKDIYGDTAPRCRALFDAIKSDCFKAAFDFANFVQVGQDPVEAWDMLHDEVVYIHIKDAVTGNNENVVAGTGDGHLEDILKRAIVDEGYEGFLTLEPHLVIFDALKQLETKDVSDIIHGDKAKDGPDGYAKQYHALLGILERIGVAAA